MQSGDEDDEIPKDDSPSHTVVGGKHYNTFAKAAL